MATKKSATKTKTSTAPAAARAVVETTAVVETVVAATAPVVAVKAPTKASRALVIFNEALAVRQQEIADNVEMEKRTFPTNRSFRKFVTDRYMAELDANAAGAAGMYNNGKTAAEKLIPDLGLGRDPKKEKPVRAPKTVVVTTTTTVEAPAADAPAGEPVTA